MRRSEAEERLSEAFAEAEERHRCLVVHNPAMYEALRRRVRAGRAVRPLPGMAMRRELWDELARRPRARWRYAQNTYHDYHPHQAFCAFSAALEYGLWVPARQLGMLHLAVETPSHVKSSKKVARHCCPVKELDEIDGVPVTSLMRTVLDCSLLGSFGDGLSIADSAMRFCNLDRGVYRKYVDRTVANRPHAGRAREVARFADGMSENGGESLVRARIIELGFRPPTSLQTEFADPVEGGRTLRVDMFYEFEGGRCLIVEVDGLEKYGDRNGEAAKTRDELVKERQRESHLTALGIPVMRVLFARLYEPGYLDNLLTSYGVPRRSC